MRAAYHLAFAVFSLGAVATPTAAPNATNHPGAPVPGGQQRTLLDTVRGIAADLSTRPASRQEATSAPGFGQDVSVGESLSKDVELHPIPRHETYRYAVVSSQRVIVDAASRRIVYVVR